MQTLRLSLALAAALVCSPLAARDTLSYSANITESEVLAAQQAWGQALVSISKAYETGGRPAAAELAGKVIDEAYGYNLGPVLFKPTLTQAPQTFRTTRDGALAYFVGGDKNYPNDTGFALKGWTGVEIRNAAIHINGDVASTMGNVILTNKDGSTTIVDKTWNFKKTDDGKLRIVLHHSSLPYSN
ncbi:MAG: hypothetical protein U1F26_05115 [Lysobacterales bacterium]